MIIEAVGCFLDLGAVAFSTYLVWTLQMPFKRRLSVAAIFATRLLSVPARPAELLVRLT